MAKITLPDISGQFASVTAINSRLQQIEDDLNDKVLYRDNPVGEPNAMANDFDMAGNRILNLPAPNALSEPVRLSDITDTNIAFNNIITEEETLSDGQTLVNLTPNSEYTSFYIVGPNADNGRLGSDDYSYTASSGALTLTNSYPEGTLLIAAANDLETDTNTITLYESVAEMVSSSPLSGAIVQTKGYYSAGDGGGASYLVQTSAAFGGSPDGYGDHTLGNGNVAVLQNAGRKRTKQYGAVGDYVPASDIGTDDTGAMQALYDSLQDGNTVVHEGNILITRDSASLKTIDGVASYICVASGIDNLTVTGSGIIYQRYNVSDTVGTAFHQCKNLHLDMPTYDGNYEYTASTPITFTQQLLHIIDCRGSKGGFTVRKCANIGFAITNKYGGTFNQDTNNTSVFHTVISENCLQNTTFGVGVQKVVINSFVCKNPVTAAIKFSSRHPDGAPVGLFDGLRIDNFVCSFDGDYVNPRNAANTAANDDLAILDNVSQAQNCSIGYAYMDLNEVAFDSIGLKHVSRDDGVYGNQQNGVLTCDTLVVKNQTSTGSVAVLIDREVGGTIIGKMEVDNIARGIQITEVESGAATQTKTTKYLDVGSIVATANVRALVTVANWDADFIRIGSIKQGVVTTTQQTFYVDGTCDINTISLPDLDVTDAISINGTVNNRIILRGRVDVSAQARRPVNLNMSGRDADVVFELDIIGDGNASRDVYINNVRRLDVGPHALSGCPLGFNVDRVDLVNVADTSPEYRDLTVLQPWQFDTTETTQVQGVIQYTGSPSNTLLASSGLVYKRTDEGAGTALLYFKILDTESSSRLLGWRTVDVS